MKKILTVTARVLNLLAVIGLIYLFMLPTKAKAMERMHCEKVASNTFRCENREAVCYRSGLNRGGLSCKFK